LYTVWNSDCNRYNITSSLTEYQTLIGIRRYSPEGVLQTFAYVFRCKASRYRDCLYWHHQIVCIIYMYIYLLAVENMWDSSISNLRGPSWSWSYGSWIYNCLCNQCLSPLKLWVQIQLMRGVLDTTLCDKVCQWLAVGGCFRVLRFPPPIMVNLTATI
jgi:hypothetical protein